MEGEEGGGGSAGRVLRQSQLVPEKWSVERMREGEGEGEGEKEGGVGAGGEEKITNTNTT